MKWKIAETAIYEIEAETEHEAEAVFLDMDAEERNETFQEVTSRDIWSDE